jgi:lipoprotein-anchoring transpeptidase ErfK/SrfK
LRKHLSLLAGVGIVVALGASLAVAAPAGAASGVSVRAFGGAPSLGAPTQPLNAPLVGIASSRSGKGYWLLAQDGGIFSYGKAKFYGSTGAMHLNQPVVGIAATPNGGGYWLVASDGGIFSFGNAHFHGSTGAMHLNSPIVGMASTPGGLGYWLVAADGGIFSFGNAHFHGSTGAMALGSPVVGITSTANGRGYWIATADGRIFNFGDAGRMPAVATSSPIVGLTRDPAPVPQVTRRTGVNDGLWLVASDGAVFASGAAKYHGNATGSSAQAVGIAAAGVGHGYWVAMGPSGPALPPNSGTGRRIVYSNKQQRMWLVEANGVVWHTFLVSGRHGLPSVGVHQVYSKVTSSPSGNLTLPWTLRFAVSSSGNPIDIHGIPLEPNGTPIEPDSLLGTPQSHGCIRMNQADAKFVWDWSTIGTTVVVTDLGF